MVIALVYHWYLTRLAQFINFIIDVVAQVRHVAFICPKVQQVKDGA